MCTHPVAPLLWGSVVYYVTNEIVSGPGCVFILDIIWEEISKLDVTQGEVYNRRILFHKEIVFGESLYVQNDVPWNRPGLVSTFKKVLCHQTSLMEFNLTILWCKLLKMVKIKIYPIPILTLVILLAQISWENCPCRFCTPFQWLHWIWIASCRETPGGLCSHESRPWTAAAAGARWWGRGRATPTLQWIVCQKTNENSS